MKIKRLFTLAALLTSSLAGALDLEDKYYAGLNFGGGYSSGLNLRPNILLGYHYQESSKFELEINSNIQSLKSIGAGLLFNYRYYPKLDIDPVTLYVSGGLGGYVQIIGGSNSGSSDAKSEAGDGPSPAETPKTEVAASPVPVGDDAVQASDGTVRASEDAVQASSASSSSTLDKILGYVAYKVKVGVDYEFTPQIIGAFGLNVGGQLNQLLDLNVGTGFELGIRYNF